MAFYLEIQKVGHWVSGLHLGQVMVPQSAMVERYGRDYCLVLRIAMAQHWVHLTAKVQRTYSAVHLENSTY
jgi:hypothetical protein